MSLPGLLLALSALTSGAQPQAELLKLFPKRAPIQADASALPWVRVGLSSELLRECSGDLSDVRVLTEAGETVPYRVFRAPEKGAERKEVKVLAATREQAPTEGGAPPMVTERYRLEVPRLPAGAQTWRLFLSTEAKEFTRHAELRSTAQGSLWSGTIFRLPQMGAEKLEIPLAGLLGTAELELEISGQGEAPVSPRFQLEASTRSPSAPTLRIASDVKPAAQGSLSVITLERPSGVVPERISFATSTPVFARRVRVFDLAAAGAERLLSEERIFRLGGSTEVENLAVKLKEATGEWLRIEITDEDSGPLAELSVELLLEQPTLLFALSQVQAQDPLWLYFGGGRAKPPHYDLASLGVWDTSKGLAAPLSFLGPIEPNAAFQPGRLLAAFQRAGAPVEVELFSHYRPLLLEGSGDGLSELLLAPADTALLRPDFGDVRLVDEADSQWPYLLRKLTTSAVSQGRLLKQEESRSIYELGLPASPSWVSSVELEPASFFFSRRAELWGIDEAGTELHLASAQLVNNPSTTGQRTQLSFTLSGPRRLKSLSLRIENGQEAPLDSLSAHLGLLVPSLLTVAPQGNYRLLLGSADQAPPSYDLQRARELVLNLRPLPASLQLQHKNPSFRPALAFARAATPSRLLLWACLAAAVLVLGALALRMARTEAR